MTSFSISLLSSLNAFSSSGVTSSSILIQNLKNSVLRIQTAMSGCGCSEPIRSGGTGNIVYSDALGAFAALQQGYTSLGCASISGDRCRDPGPDSTEGETTRGKTYKTGSVKRYCDVLESGVEGSPQMLSDIMKDLQCVFEKTFGNSKTLEGNSKGLHNQIACLKEQIAELEACKTKLQKELCRIQSELMVAQKAYDDETERRMALEKMVTNLRIKLSRLEAMAEVDAKDKAELAACLLELEGKLKDACDIIECLEIEKKKLLAQIAELEEFKRGLHHNVTESTGRCDELEEALIKCCKMNEELQRQVAYLRKERDCLVQLVEKLQSELRRLCEEFEKERQCWANERIAMEKTICELKNALDCQILKNREICERMSKVVAAHHREMDCLKKAGDRFAILYQEEKAARERLEEALRDCEEQKEKLQQRQYQQQPQSQTSPQANEINLPCSDISEILRSLNLPC